MKQRLKILQVGPGNKKFRTEYFIKQEFQKLHHIVLTYNDQKLHALFLCFSHFLFRCLVRLFDPDVILFSKAKKISLKNFRWAQQRYITVMWYFDIRNPFDKEILERAKYVDRFFITNRGQISELRKQQVYARYLPQACITRYIPETGPYLYDVSFIGNNNKNYGMRKTLLNKIGLHYNLHVWGARWNNENNFTPHDRISGQKYADMCARSKVVLDIKSFEYCLKERQYCSNRLFLTLGFGGFLLSQYVPRMELLFQDRVHLVYFSTEQEAMELIDYYLQHEEERKKIAAQGKELTLKHHTYRNRIIQIMNDLNLD